LAIPWLTKPVFSFYTRPLIARRLPKGGKAAPWRDISQMTQWVEALSQRFTQIGENHDRHFLSGSPLSKQDHQLT
jgi:predicted ATPase